MATLTLAPAPVKTNCPASELARAKYLRAAGDRKWAVDAISLAETIRGNGWFANGVVTDNGAAILMGQSKGLGDRFAAEVDSAFLMVAATPNGPIVTLGSPDRESAIRLFNNTVNGFRKIVPPHARFMVKRVRMEGIGAGDCEDSRDEVVYDRPMSFWDVVEELREFELEAGELMTEPEAAGDDWVARDVLTVTRLDGSPIDPRMMTWLYRNAGH